MSPSMILIDRPAKFRDWPATEVASTASSSAEAREKVTLAPRIGVLSMLMQMWSEREHAARREGLVRSRRSALTARRPSSSCHG